MTSAASQQRTMMICLSDLPTGALAHVSSFLASPSRALFAVALISRDVERSSAIVGGQWDALDFGDIEKELAAKLSDDDISGVLLCIDAVSTLKKLRLTNCIDITGVGLEPLRGSTIIEKIDLSLVADHESPRILVPQISCYKVLPLLDSIIERGGQCALKHLQFPEIWRRVRNTESVFHAFLRRYKSFLMNSDVSCLKCNDNVGLMIEMREYDQDQYGTQKCTCCDCMKHYCGDCEDDDGVGYIMSIPCKWCDRIYCLHCKAVNSCYVCGYWCCVDGCGDFRECTRCQESICPRCVSKGCYGCGVDDIWCQFCVDDGLRYCEGWGCDEKYCDNCCSSNVYAVKFCNGCQDSLCGRCRVKNCKEWRDCTECCQLALPPLLEDKETQRQEMQSENDELRSENNELKRKIEDMTG